MEITKKIWDATGRYHRRVAMARVLLREMKSPEDDVLIKKIGEILNMLNKELREVLDGIEFIKPKDEKK